MSSENSKKQAKASPFSPCLSSERVAEEEAKSSVVWLRAHPLLPGWRKVPGWYFAVLQRRATSMPL